MLVQGSALYRPSVLTVADFLQVSSTKSSLGVATAQSRALTWVARYAGLPMLQDALSSPIIKSYMFLLSGAEERSCPSSAEFCGISGDTDPARSGYRSRQAHHGVPACAGMELPPVERRHLGVTFVVDH